MTDLSGNTWLVLAGACAASLVAILHTLAARVGNQVKVHDLKADVNRLRTDYAKRVREIEELTDVIEAIPVEEFEAAEKQRKEVEKFAA